MRPERRVDWTNGRIEASHKTHFLLMLPDGLRNLVGFILSTGNHPAVGDVRFVAILCRRSNIGIGFYKTIHYWIYWIVF